MPVRVRKDGGLDDEDALCIYDMPVVLCFGVIGGAAAAPARYS